MKYNILTSDIKNKALCLLFMLCFFFMCRNIPLQHDDFQYLFIYPNQFGTPTDFSREDAVEIKSLSDVLLSQWNHYWYWNGRTIVHTIVQIFDALLGKFYYDLLLTCSLSIFIISYFKVVYNRHCIDWNKILFILFLFFVCFPSHTDLYFGIAFSCNYVIAPAMVYTFIWAIKNNYNSLFAKIILSLGAFVSGWSHEILSIPIGIILFLYLFNNYRRIPIYKKISIVCFLLGMSILIAAPSNYMRLFNYRMVDEYAGTGFIKTRLRFFEFVSVLYLFLLALLYSKHLRKINVLCFLKKNLYLVLALCISILLMLIVGSFSPRDAFAVNLFSAMLLLRLSEEACFRTVFLELVCRWILIIGMILVPYYTSLCKKQHDRIDKIISNTSGPEAFAMVKSVKVPLVIDRFVVKHEFLEQESHVNKWYYKKNSLVVWESDKCINETNSFANCFCTPFKIAGNNSLYRFGDYCYSKEPLDGTLKLNLEFGDIDFWSFSGFMKTIKAMVNGPCGNLTVSVPVEKIYFQGNTYYRIFLWSNPVQPIESIDFL